MAITSSGFYCLSFEKALIDTLGESLEAEDNKILLVTDTYAPNFDTHDFRNDITNEVSGTGYSAGGAAFTSTELTISSGVVTWDFADPSWTTSTISNAMAGVTYTNVGADTTDQLLLLLDFVTAVSTSAGTLAVALAAGGAATWDLVP
jgi:hypothetical protein